VKKSKSKISKKGYIILIIAAILQFSSLAVQQYVVQLEGDIRDIQDYIPELNNKYQNIYSNYQSLSSLYSEYLEASEYMISNSNPLDAYTLENFINNTSYFMDGVIQNKYIQNSIDRPTIDNFLNLQQKVKAINVDDLDKGYDLLTDYLYEILEFNRVALKEAGRTLGEIDNYNIIANKMNNNKQIYLLTSIVLEIISFLLILIFFRLFIKKNLFSA
jgi:hypothetical protein